MVVRRATHRLLGLPLRPLLLALDGAAELKAAAVRRRRHSQLEPVVSPLGQGCAAHLQLELALRQQHAARRGGQRPLDLAPQPARPLLRRAAPLRPPDGELICVNLPRAVRVHFLTVQRLRVSCRLKLAFDGRTVATHLAEMGEYAVLS